MEASFEDLQRELWFRWRNRGIIVWENEDGTKVPIKDMKLSDLFTAMRNSKETQINDPFEDEEQTSIRILKDYTNL